MIFTEYYIVKETPEKFLMPNLAQAWLYKTVLVRKHNGSWKVWSENKWQDTKPDDPLRIILVRWETDTNTNVDIREVSEKQAEFYRAIL